MDKIIAQRNEKLGKALVANLEKRQFAAYYCADKASALAKAMELIPETDVVSWGGCHSCEEIGLITAVKARNKVIDRALAKNPAEKTEIMRQALLCDTFLMGTNAVSLDGQLINIDGTGNRCAALIYGPKQVIVIAGINKVAADLDAAMVRARTVAAPINAQRFDITTPCKKVGSCFNCMNNDGICNQIVTTRHCRPAGRIKVIVVGEELGY